MGFLDNLFGAQSLPSSPTAQGTQTTTPSIQPQFQPYITNYLNQAQNLAANQQTPELLNQSYVEAKGLQLPGGRRRHHGQDPPGRGRGLYLPLRGSL